MARSSTSYQPKWKLGRTTVIRVPQKLARVVLHYAQELDDQSQPQTNHHSAADHRTGAAVGTAEPLDLAPVLQRPRLRKNPLRAPARAQRTKLRCDIRATFATAFRNWRLREKIPLKKLATDLGLTVATISLWELGKRFPSARHFEMLMNYTGVPPCRLFCVMAEKCVPAECLLAIPQKP